MPRFLESWLRPAVRARLACLGPWGATIFFFAVVAATTARHEMWRDELQGWLVARDSSMPWDLLHNMRYEGHPPLWQFLLWPIAHLTWNPQWMQALQVAIASGVAFLVLHRSPFPWPVRLLVVSGYFFSYEWAVFSRNYGIVVLVLFGVCSLYQERRTNYRTIGALLGLLCLTHVGGLIFAVAIATTLAAEVVLERARQGVGGSWPRGFAVGMLFAGVGFLVAWGVASPPRNAFYAPSARRSIPDAERLSVAVINAFLPVPVDRLTFWNSNEFTAPRHTSIPYPLSIPGVLRTPVAACILAFCVVLLASRRWMILPFAIATGGLLAFFRLVYYGSVRHHGFLYLGLVATLWMSFAHESEGIEVPSGSIRTRFLAFVERHRMEAFAVLAAVHVWAAAIAIRTDWGAAFSRGKETAAWLNDRIPDRDAVVFVGDSSSSASTVVGYLGLERIYYPDRGDYGSFVVFDRRRSTRTARDFGDRVRLLTAALRKPAVLVLSYPLPADTGLGRRAHLAACFHPAIVTNEEYWIYVVDQSDQSGIGSRGVLPGLEGSGSLGRGCPS